jgi:hypothetical protein
VHTPAIELESGAKTVIILGMTHVAPYEYFEIAQRTIQHYESKGFTVMYEDLDGVEAALYEKIGATFEIVLQTKRAAFAVLNERFDVWYQVDAIPIQPHWINSDDLSTLIFLMEQGANNDWSSIITERKERFELILKDPERWYEMVQVLAQHQRQSSQRIRPRHYETMTFRERRLAEKIASTPNHESIIAFWGNSHLIGIETELKRKGFSTRTA